MGCQSAYHQSNHSDADHGCASLDENLVIFTQSTKAPQPGKGSLYDPTMVQKLETLGIIRSFHNLQNPGSEFFRPIHQLPRVSTVSPDLLQTRKTGTQLLQNQLGSIPVLNIRRMNNKIHNQPQRVDDEVPLAAFDFLPRVVPSGAPFSVVLTLWLSIAAALGLASRPAFWRTRSRRA